MPYGFVQLANFVGNGGVSIRWHQTADYGYTPNPSMENVFMAVAIDTYDEPNGIHPRYKSMPFLLLKQLDCHLNSILLGTNRLLEKDCPYLAVTLLMVFQHQLMVHFLTQVGVFR